MELFPKFRKNLQKSISLFLPGWRETTKQKPSIHQKAQGQDFDRRAALDEIADRADEDPHENHGDDHDIFIALLLNYS